MKTIKIERRTYVEYQIDNLTLIDGNNEITFKSKKEMATYLGITRQALSDKLSDKLSIEPIISSPSIKTSELIDYLNNNSEGLKMAKKAILQLNIDNGTITTLDELKEELD